MASILVLGSTTQDIFIKSPDVAGGSIPLGEKFDASEVVKTLGGGGANMAVSFARQGFSTTLISRVGDDETGRVSEAGLMAEQVEAQLQKDAEHPTAQSYIIVSADGERTIFQMRGANDYLEIPDLNGTRVSWVYVVDTLGNLDISIFRSVFEWAKDNNVNVAVTPDKHLIEKKDEILPLLRTADIVIMNDSEAELLGEKTGKICVITKGKDGSSAHSEGKIYKAGIPDSPIVDRTGAGDAFGSGFVAEYIRSGNIDKALKFGTDNATSVIQYYGGTKGLLRVL